jgi:hypothetical protein
MVWPSAQIGKERKMAYSANGFLCLRAVRDTLIVLVAVCTAAEPVASGSFKHIKTESEFRSSIVDRSLIADWGTMMIHSDGRITGNVENKGKIVGAWNWQGAFWCRNVRIGKDKPIGTDCQKMSIDGNKMQFLRDQGTSDGGVFTIGN